MFRQYYMHSEMFGMFKSINHITKGLKQVKSERTQHEETEHRKIYKTDQVFQDLQMAANHIRLPYMPPTGRNK